MFNISKLVNRITDRGNGRDGSSEGGTPSFVEPEEQHSAEGFLCPPCMRAFPNAESLEEHYNATHLNNGENQPSPDSTNISPTNGDIQILRQEIQSLQSCLAEEKTTSEELKREVLKMQAGLQSMDEDSLSMKSQEKEFDSTKNLLTSEVTLLRQQLTDTLEKISHVKKEKELLGQNLLELSTENKSMKSELISMKAQLSHKNSIDDTAVLKLELVSVQRMMDQLSQEKEKQIEELNEKIQLLENSTKEVATEEIEIEKLNEAIKKAELLEKQLKESTDQNDKIQSECAAEKKQWSEDLEQLKEKLNDSDQKRKTFEQECIDLKEEVKRLQEQHTELYSKVEGGEGAKAALDALQKENEILKDNLESSQEKFNELSKNMYNTNKQLEKSQSEHKKLSEAFAAETEEWKAKGLLWKDQITQKEEEVKRAMVKNEELVKAIQQKENEVQIIKTSMEKSTGELRKEIKSLQTIKDQQSTRLSELESEIKSLRETVQQNEKALQISTSSNEKLLKDLQEKTKEFDETSRQLEGIHKIKQELEEKLSNAEKIHNETRKTFLVQIESLEGKLEGESQSLKRKTEELEATKKSSEEALTKLKAEMERLKGQVHEKEEHLEELKKDFQDVKSKYDERESRIQVLEAQTDEILGEKIELEKRVKSSEEEKSLLLEKCLSIESETEELRQTIKSMQRKLEDSHAALQELGRENQSLQMESAKLQGRKWADDSVVTNCSTCEKEFTLTIRKHHCRQCGQIFCNDCSSRTASVPSCKKPARVCDTCYQDLMTK